MGMTKMNGLSLEIERIRDTDGRKFQSDVEEEKMLKKYTYKKHTTMESNGSSSLSLSHANLMNLRGSRRKGRRLEACI